MLDIGNQKRLVVRPIVEPQRSRRTRTQLKVAQILAIQQVECPATKTCGFYEYEMIVIEPQST